MILMEVLGLQVEAVSGAPLVLLRETDDPHRVLPVFIGPNEAVAIAIGIQHATTERPSTHDLLVDVLGELGADLRRVDVTELRDGTFIAEIELRDRAGSVRRVSARPSDAIALAVRVDAPVFAAEAVLDEAGAELQVQDDDDETPDEPERARAEPVLSEDEIEHEVAEFRRALASVQPEDFREPEDPREPEDRAGPAGGDEAAGGS